MRKAPHRALKAGEGLCLAGAPEGTRTPNLLIRSQMLYPLSYGRSHNRHLQGVSAGPGIALLPDLPDDDFSMSPGRTRVPVATGTRVSVVLVVRPTLAEEPDMQPHRRRNRQS